MNILKDNGKYLFYNSLNIEKELKPKNYLFNFDKFGNCWLEDLEAFKFPDKIFDVNQNLRDLIRVSFNTNKKNLGVLLTGNKGQGKSLTAKLICKEANIPTIVINKQVPINIDFIQFFNDVKQDYVLFIDEFEKLFNSSKNTSSGEESSYHSQETFLSFIDGVFTNTNKVLFLLTTNESVNQYFINRPSRIKFLQEYDELPEELFNMIVDDKLVNKEFKQDLEDNISMVNLNIDLLISIIDDINLFNKPFSSFIEHYNYKFESYRYEVNMIKDNRESFDKFFNSDKKVRANWKHIAGYNVDQIIKFTKDEIVFTTQSGEYDKDDNWIPYKATIKLTPAKAFKEYAF